MNDAIAAYANKLDPQRAEICANLCGAINEMLPQATPKLWHGIPVWFMGENPAVGYTARKQGVMLMFWSGQHFAEPELEASGSFHMAQIPYNDASEINREKLAVWLSKAGTIIWDMVGERNAFVAKRREEKAQAKAPVKAKPKAKAKPKPKAKAKTKVKAKVKAKAKSKTKAKAKVMSKKSSKKKRTARKK